MTIAEAKQVRIVDFLAQLGHHAQHIKSEQYWYFSPLRNERTPSFKVNDRINEWYDFGEATGGDLVELVKYICRTDSVSEALAYIERLVNGASLPRTRMPTAPPRPVEAEMKDVIVIPLRHHALFSYLQSRLIDADISRMYCKEVHYELRGRHYFALAFGNISGGYEVRNAYYKGMPEQQGHLIDKTSNRRDTGKRLCLRGIHGFSFLYDTETGRRPDGLSCHTMRLPRDELGKQFEKDAGTFTGVFGHSLLSRQ